VRQLQSDTRDATVGGVADDDVDLDLGSLGSTDNDNDDGCRTILAASMPAAIAIFKAQITAEGQTVSVSTIRSTKI
jgi:hypothetical protein